MAVGKDRYIARMSAEDRKQEEGHRSLLLSDTFSDLALFYLKKATEVVGFTPKMTEAALSLWEMLLYRNILLLDELSGSEIESLLFRSILLRFASEIKPVVFTCHQHDVLADIERAKSNFREAQKFRKKVVSLDSIKIGERILEQYGSESYFYFLLSSVHDLPSVIHISLQAPFPKEHESDKNMRVDALAWSAVSPKRFILECDGYLYHSSKKSFAEDRRRDRVLLRKDCTVLRFSGSEIYQSPVVTGSEVYDTIVPGLRGVAKKKSRGFGL